MHARRAERQKDQNKHASGTILEINSLFFSKNRLIFGFIKYGQQTILGTIIKIPSIGRRTAIHE